jgi:hypothetical protein
LWQLLLGEVEKLSDQSLSFTILHIPREYNDEADEAAKEAARTKIEKAEFADITLGPYKTTSADGGSIEIELQPYVLAVCLAGESEDVLDFYEQFTTDFPPKGRLEPVYNPKSALKRLNGSSPLLMILVADAMIVRRRQVWERIIEHMHNGARVVFAGCFSSMVTSGEFRRIFTSIGLPWERGSHSRIDAELQTRVLDAHVARELPPALWGPTAFVSNVQQSNCWYVFPHAPGDAAAAFTEAGLGRVGYIGCVYGLADSVRVAQAMLGQSLSTVIKQELTW